MKLSSTSHVHFPGNVKFTFAVFPASVKLLQGSLRLEVEVLPLNFWGLNLKLWPIFRTNTKIKIRSLKEREVSDPWAESSRNTSAVTWELVVRCNTYVWRNTESVDRCWNWNQSLGKQHVWSIFAPKGLLEIMLTSGFFSTGLPWVHLNFVASRTQEPVIRPALKWNETRTFTFTATLMAYNCWARSHKGHSLWIAKKTSTWPEFTVAYSSSGFGQRFWAEILGHPNLPVFERSGCTSRFKDVLRHAPCAVMQSYVHLTGLFRQVLSAPNRRAKSMEEWTDVTLRIKGYIIDNIYIYYSKRCITQCIL